MPIQPKTGSLGIGVEVPRFGGVTSAPHPSHPQIWTFSRKILKNLSTWKNLPWRSVY